MAQGYANSRKLVLLLQVVRAHGQGVQARGRNEGDVFPRRAEARPEPAAAGRRGEAQGAHKNAGCPVPLLQVDQVYQVVCECYVKNAGW